MPTRLISLRPEFRGHSHSEEFVGVKKVERLKIHSLCIPNTSYGVNKNNNVMSFDAGNITLTPGNYSPDEFAGEIETQLQSNYSGATVTYDQKTAKLTINLPTASSLDLNKPAQRLTGFSPVSSPGTTLTAPRTISLSPTPVYYLKFDDIAANTNIKFSATMVLNNNVAFGNYLYFLPSDDIFNMNTTRADFLDQVELSLLDFDGNHVDLNNDVASIVLEVEYGGWK